MAVLDHRAAIAQAQQQWEQTRSKHPLPPLLKRSEQLSLILGEQIIALLGVADASLSLQDLHNDLASEFPRLSKPIVSALLEHLSRAGVVSETPIGRDRRWQLAKVISTTPAKRPLQINVPVSDTRVRLREPRSENDWWILAECIYRNHPVEKFEAFVDVVKARAHAYGYDISMAPSDYCEVMLVRAYLKLNPSQ